MGDSSSRTGSFTIKDEPIENQRPMRVVVIGAGFSGIYTTIRLSQRLRNVSIQVYEQNEEVSGVWWMNRYPGLACDIPSYSYQFSFAPSPYWSSLYAPGPEIRRYMQDVAMKYGAMRFIKVSHAVQSCTWDEIRRKWNVEIKNLKTGEIIEDTADVVVTAKGDLNQIKWPKIKNLETYQGKLMHSGAWDDNVRLTNKRIGVIGNGSSAIQIVPTIQKMEGTKVWNFARSPTWVSTSFGDTAMIQLGLDPRETKFSRSQQEHMAKHPDHFHKMRKILEKEASSKHLFTLKNSQSQETALVKFQEHMRQRLAGRPDLFEAIIPTFAPGCRRLTPGPGYLESLQQDNVTFCKTAIQEFNSTGLKLETGEQIDLDVIICATGYDVQAPPTFTVKGRNGKTLEERWKPIPESYLAITVDQFPNFFMIGGPNSNLGAGSLLSVFEAQGDYATKIIRKLQKESYETFEVRPERVADFSNYIDEYFKLTVYTDECSSWYRAHSNSNRIVALWPGSALHCLETLRSPRWEDYIWKSAEPSGNLLRWLGNGNTLVLSKGDPSWFLEERYLDVPKEGKPEETETYQQRPFSH
ncbi:uncharacterized protein EKO05_0006626 [Ascochyta rabiei]|uniref:Uncharacterized protein n=1 Tax=Didymella rabiei TaxID=5454 RepID=A0A162W1I3_DIDRA|nr:uncharacterized protein EKO05_0006626 [Ascochyta rabiei]KZM18733.1 hypothetical protein ST47_g10016 [Ascochyta rabiei]UPX16213.1 hypothetical protein EKO05_0006626 [Ascochyta rabiei]